MSTILSTTQSETVIFAVISCKFNFFSKKKVLKQYIISRKISYSKIFYLNRLVDALCLKIKKLLYNQCSINNSTMFNTTIFSVNRRKLLLAIIMFTKKLLLFIKFAIWKINLNWFNSISQAELKQNHIQCWNRKNKSKINNFLQVTHMSLLIIKLKITKLWK